MRGRPSRLEGQVSAEDDESELLDAYDELLVCVDGELCHESCVVTFGLHVLIDSMHVFFRQIWLYSSSLRLFLKYCTSKM